MRVYTSIFTLTHCFYFIILKVFNLHPRKMKSI
jgi:hypothetical protein